MPSRRFKDRGRRRSTHPHKCVHRVRVGRNPRLRHDVRRMGGTVDRGRSVHRGCSAHFLSVGLLRGSGRVRGFVSALPGNGRVVTVHGGRALHVHGIVGRSDRRTVASTGCNFVAKTLGRAFASGRLRGRRAAHIVSDVIARHV